MNYCIKTYRALERLDTPFAENFSNKIEIFLDSIDKYKIWIRKRKHLKFLFITYHIYQFLVVILLIITIIFLNKKILQYKVYFEEGKKYDTSIIFSDTDIRISYDKNDKFGYFDFKLNKPKNNRFFGDPYYYEYFTEDIKLYRKLKLKKINKK